MTIVLANGSYRDTIETEISRLYSDLYETELEKMRSPERGSASAGSREKTGCYLLKEDTA